MARTGQLLSDAHCLSGPHKGAHSIGQCSYGERTYRGSSQHCVALGVSHISTGKVVPQDSKNPVIVPFLSLQDHLPGDELLGATGPKAAAVPLQDGSYVPAGVGTLVPGNTTGLIDIRLQSRSPITFDKKEPKWGCLPPLLILLTPQNSPSCFELSISSVPITPYLPEP